MKNASLAKKHSNRYTAFWFHDIARLIQSHVWTFSVMLIQISCGIKMDWIVCTCVIQRSVNNNWFSFMVYSVLSINHFLTLCAHSICCLAFRPSPIPARTIAIIKCCAIWMHLFFGYRQFGRCICTVVRILWFRLTFQLILISPQIRRFQLFPT